ncbi:hypothetical protein PVAND_011310 [Polypedilum vanderplanki]|uniref:Uncharacterized protein n=1 Tax=Polypedilum vanderplanki TaxID=319348 RepID=A0A9J6CI63_POLVA|nr:hypothetical protein PVAND_011310 [Polypedilum vanderplanki]
MNGTKIKVTTRCVVVPPSPENSDDEEDYNVDSNKNSDNNSNINSTPISPSTNQPKDIFYAQPTPDCSQAQSSSESTYTRNRSTTRSWPVIYRNNSLTNQQQQSNFLEPNQQYTKTEQLQSRSVQQKRKSTHQYDFDQIFGLNNANYQQYLATHRKSSNFDTGYDKSPSIYDMQQHTQEGEVEQTQTSTFCHTPPTIIFLLVTLLMTTSATSMLCAAFLTDHWENLYWDKTALMNIVNQTDSTKMTNNLEFLLEGKVARLPLRNKLNREHQDRGGVFLVPMHGGIWTLCINLNEDEIKQLHEKGFPTVKHCFNYLSSNSDNSRNEEQRPDWQHRMQNLSISCALVCLIILGSAALIGAFGVCQRQISAILVTGVMYLLAALFALFTLMIIHFKRQKGKPLMDSDYDGTVDGLIAESRGSARMAQNLLGARTFNTSYSLDLGWGGVALCALASFLWIFLSKLMRFTPLSQLM